MNAYDDPEYKGKVELAVTEAEMRKQCIGSIHYTLAISLLQSKSPFHAFCFWWSRYKTLA